MWKHFFKSFAKSFKQEKMFILETLKGTSPSEFLLFSTHLLYNESHNMKQNIVYTELQLHSTRLHSMERKFINVVEGEVEQFYGHRRVSEIGFNDFSRNEFWKVPPVVLRKLGSHQMKTFSQLLISVRGKCSGRNRENAQCFSFASISNITSLLLSFKLACILYVKFQKADFASLMNKLKARRCFHCTFVQSIFVF